ncbi:MAG: lysoplasmalogenase [Kofleriaceae bacterium]
MIATIVCAVACATLVVAEWRALAGLRIAAKTIASIAFLVVGYGAASGSFGEWMFIGLVFGAIGDVALLGRGRGAFLAGLGAFLVGHVAYVVGIAQLVEPAAWLGHAGWLAAVPGVAGIAVVAGLWTRLRSLKVPVLAYVAAIVAMVIAATAAARAGALPEPQNCWLPIGAGLFFISDLAVARDRFVGRSFTNKLWGLPAYYAAQLLIAWTIR